MRYNKNKNPITVSFDTVIGEINNGKNIGEYIIIGISCIKCLRPSLPTSTAKLMA